MPHFTPTSATAGSFDTKAYTTRYWNKQFYQNGATVNLTPAKPSGVDKLNGYRHAGDTAILSKESKWGVFRTGIWYDWAYTDRYQVPSNILTQVNTPLPNFHEHFITQSYQPFAEFEWRATQKLVVTAGIKAADYNMHLNQYQDNGKTVGCLGGVASTYPATAGIWAGAPSCIGGVAFVTHGINYNNWLPTSHRSLSRMEAVVGLRPVRRRQRHSAEQCVRRAGRQCPYAAQPTLAKTYQGGSVLKLNRFTLDVDVYYVHFQNGYQSYIDPTTNEPVFVATGPSNTKGFEAESNVALPYGLSVYGNFTVGSAKYQTGANYPNGGHWVANTPSNVEGVSLLWQHRNYDMGLTWKRVGQYYQDNGSLPYKINGISVPYPVDEALTIQPWNLVNVFVNYTVKNSSHFRGTKIQLAVNNSGE